MPSFDDVVTHWPDAVQRAFGAHWRAAAHGPDVTALSARLGKYEELLGRIARQRPFLDLDTAQKTVLRCHEMLSLPVLRDDDHARRWAAAAVLYLMSEGDADTDLDSPSGFEDDWLVVDTIARALAAGH